MMNRLRVLLLVPVLGLCAEAQFFTDLQPHGEPVGRERIRFRPIQLAAYPRFAADNLTNGAKGTRIRGTGAGFQQISTSFTKFPSFPHAYMTDMPVSETLDTGGAVLNDKNEVVRRDIELGRRQDGLRVVERYRTEPRFDKQGRPVLDRDGNPVFALPGQRFGPELTVHTHLDEDGLHQLWGQFRLADGRVITVPFTVNAT